ncbi:hypothetical protein ACFLSV_07120 [Bacteroidota bacterium]
MKNIHSFLFRVITISIFFFTIFNSSYAQRDSLIIGREYKITLFSGFEMTGIVRSFTPDTVKIKTKYKTFNVPQYQIATIEDLKIIRTGGDSTRVIFKPDPNESRLFLSPTGKTLKAGHGYISTALLIPWVAVLAFPFANIGITDYLSLGVGTNINLGIGFDPYPSLYYFAPKVRPLHLKNVDVSIGFAHVIPFDISNSDKGYNFGILYGVSSFDIQNYTLSIGSGVTYGIDWDNSGGLTVAPYPLFMLGFEARTEIDAKLISENWVSFYPNGGFISVLSFGVRQMKGNFAFDISVLGVLTNSLFDVGGGGPRDKPIFYPVLWGSVAYNFEL